MSYHFLNPEESKIIEHKGTERPFSGEYNQVFEAGVYVCKRCDYPLFLSESKFDAGCGWPSFDEALEGHVTTRADGDRVEIVCSRCSAHLGHVFKGERLTHKNTRHCTNSLSLRFVGAFTGGYERAVFAGGCFWGVEHFLKNLQGVKQVVCGYIGGDVVNPTYQQVCTKKTGHVEAVELLFDPDLISYETLLKAFFEIHDFTQTNGQGPDLGAQYLSKIFIYSSKQKIAALNVIKKLEDKGYKVATKLEYSTLFYRAEKEHQDYYSRTGQTPYCHKKTKIF